MRSQSAIVVAAALGAVLVAACTISETGRACDRACLIALADSYLEALAARDPGALPLSDHVSFVENVKAMRPGEGLWASAAGTATGFRIYVPDPGQSAVGIMTVIDRQTENGIVPALLAVRLRVEAGKITEAEHQIGRASCRERV